MSENLDLRLILRNTETASRDAQAALEATERMGISVGARLSALEARFGALETRFSALETRTAGTEVTLDGIARSNARMERALADILAAVEDGATHRDAKPEPPP